MEGNSGLKLLKLNCVIFLNFTKIFTIQYFTRTPPVS